MDNLPFSNPRYSIVAPVYNSDASLYELVERIKMVFTRQIGESFEIIMVDDRSPNPLSWEAMRKIAAANPNVQAIQLMRNSGRAAAVLCGCFYAQGEYIITMDDDLQHRPEDITALVSKRDHDVVMASFPQKEHDWLTRLTSAIKGFFDSIILHKPKNLQVTSFILMRKNVKDSILQIRTPYPIIVALLFHTTTDIVNVETTHDKRTFNVSGYSVGKRLRQFAFLLINNSTLLPRLMAFFGGAVFLFSLGASILILFTYFVNGIAVPGWTSQILVTLLTNATIFLSLGVLGEYLGRIVASVEQRPPYIVRDMSPRIPSE